MAISDPDVGLLTSSAQIFASNHTLPQIRAIHKALHGQIDDKATRLRTQVGGSYRELLGTADTIVQMRVDMEGAQATLAGMGGRCGRAVVGGKVAALAMFFSHDQEQSALNLAGRARLLEACARAVGRLLSRTHPAHRGNQPSKTPIKSQERPQRHHQQQQQQTWGERLVLAAKVLVLSRLLISSLGERQGTAGDKAAAGSKDEPHSKQPGLQGQAAVQDAAVLASIEASKKTLGSLRRRLRDIVEVLEQSVPTAASTPSVSDGEGGDGNDSTSGDEGGKRGSNRIAAATATGRDDLLRALCAHSLATTSGARDVLWQLLHVRSQAMALAFDMDDDEHHDDDLQQQQNPQDSLASRKADNVLRGLALYTKTLLDVQALLPHRLPEALLGLKKRALLDDDALRQIEGLRLDVYARWCGEDVQYFKPYIRHDDLDAAQAREMLAKWAERGGDVFLSGLQRVLEQKPSPEAQQQQQQQPLVARRHLDLRAIVDLRTRVLQLWIRDSTRARGFDPSDLLNKMRAVFNKQILQVLTTKVGKLRLVASEVAATLSSWQDGVADRHVNLWSANRDTGHGGSNGGSGLDTDLSEGAVPFVREVITRLHGRSDAVAKAATSYMTWRHVIDDVQDTLHQLWRQRWDNDVDDIVEDEDTIAQRQQLLSRDDPQTLYDQLETVLATAFRELDTQIATEWAKVSSSNSSAATKGNIAMYLVRVLREMRKRRPATSLARSESEKAHSVSKASTASTTTFITTVAQLGLGIIPELHAAIVRVVATAPLDHFTSKALARKTVAGRLLWEADGAQGEQQLALPSTPSPGVFKFVRDLSAAMGSAGLDLWSPTAVIQLKQQVAEMLYEQWITLLKTADQVREDKIKDEPSNKNTENGESAKNGHAVGSQPSLSTALPEDQHRDLLLQWLFDISWLQCSFSFPNAAPTPGGKVPVRYLAELEDAVYRRTGLSEDEDGSGTGSSPRQRVTKAAQEFWKKTNLLFGLLA